MPRRTHKPADLNRLAKEIVTEATAEDAPSESPQAAAGRSGGLKGGPARADTLSAEQRSEIARNAARARWSRKPKS